MLFESFSQLMRLLFWKTSAGQVLPVAMLVDSEGAPVSSRPYKSVQSEDLGAGTKYILKSAGTDWLMVRKTYTDTASQVAYASAANNASITLATAWANRTTLTYGTAAEADA